MSIREVFQNFVNRIKPTEAELDRARNRRDFLKERVRTLDIGVFDVRNSGSYAKHTSIHPLNDIDVVFYIDIDRFPFDRSKILSQISRRLRESYPQNYVETGKHSVKLHYSDGFSVDIVPALSHNRQIEGAEIIDRETGRWIKTSIPKHVAFANKMNKKDQRYKNLVRMMKIWKDQRRRNYPSFLLELLVAHCIKMKIPRGWEVAILRMFEIVSNEKLEEPIHFNDFFPIKEIPNDHVIVLDPSNPFNNVAKFMTIPIKREFLNAWNQSYKWARSALKARYKKDKIKYWKLIFGTRFPSR